MTERAGKRSAAATIDSAIHAGIDKQSDQGNAAAFEPAHHAAPPSLAATQRDNLDAIIKSNLILFDGAIAWSSELLDFVDAQVQQQLNRPQNIGAGPAEALAAQIRHVQAATEQCVDRAARLMSLATRVSRDSCMPLAERATATLGHFTTAHQRDERTS